MPAFGDFRVMRVSGGRLENLYSVTRCFCRFANVLNSHRKIIPLPLFRVQVLHKDALLLSNALTAAKEITLKYNVSMLNK